MAEVIKSDFDEELGDLWFRRGNLNDQDATRLYKLVFSLLKGYPYPFPTGLREERAYYINGFFLQKVYRPDAKPRRIHVGGLKLIYKHFLFDELDKNRTQVKDVSSLTSFEEDEVQLDVRVEDPSNNLASTYSLADFDLNVDKVAHSAATWLAARDQWVVIYLSLHFCPAADVSEPLSKLADRMNIKSYHTKATKLGINWGMSKAGSAGVPFDETLLGQWVTRDLGIPLATENKPALHESFKILCCEALTLAETLGIEP